MGILDNIKTALLNVQGQEGTFQWPGRYVGPGSVYSDFVRVQNYHRYTNIYWGRFNYAFTYDPVFSQLSEFTTRANLAARCVDALHSAVWCGVPKPECDDPRMKAFAEELLENAKAQEAVGSNIFDVILYGDGILRVDVENSKIRVRTVNPTTYFPELTTARPQEPLAHNIVYPEDTTNTWYRRERYYWNAATQTWWLTIDRFHSQSGQTGNVSPAEDLRIRNSPIIHTYDKRLSGIFYGKGPLVDCERMVAEYAATILKLATISDMATTKALLAAPYNAFDDKGNLIWDTSKPYMVDDADMATFDKAKFGWIEPPGSSMLDPLKSTLTELKAEVAESFGLTQAIFGETGNIRDVGAPGLERVNLLMEFTVNRYQERFAAHLSDLTNVARDYAVTWLGADLPSDYEQVAYCWPAFAPESMDEKADTGAKMIAAGAPKASALEYMGLENAEQLVQQAAAETAGQFAIPHDPYDPETNPAVDDTLDSLFAEPGDMGDGK